MSLLKPAEKRKWDNRAGSRQVAPYTDEDERCRCPSDEVSPAGSDVAPIWASPTSSGEGAWVVSGGTRDRGGVGGTTTGGTSGYRHTRGSAERHSKFRRVKPIDSDGFEEALERGVHVPFVSLPERIDGQVKTENSFFF